MNKILDRRSAAASVIEQARPEMKLGAYYVDELGVLWRCYSKSDQVGVTVPVWGITTGGTNAEVSSVREPAFEIQNAGQLGGKYLIHEVSFPEVVLNVLTAFN